MAAMTLLALVATACASLEARVPAPPNQPANVGDAKLAATAYRNSGAYERELEAVTRAAASWIAEEAARVDRPALVLDIDETALSNWQVIEANDFGRVFDGPCEQPPKGPCGWVAWDLKGVSPAIPATLDLFKMARDRGVEVFFITGRDESQRAATERNLRAAGFGGYRRLVMPAVGEHHPSAADFKGPQRAAIAAEGFTIVGNVGDQPSDLAGGHAERTFLLPNPFYRIP